MERPTFLIPLTGMSVCGIMPTFAGLSPIERQIRYVFLTRLPCYSEAETPVRIRLACVRHAASVRSEPGSNSSLIYRLIRRSGYIRKKRF